jgi:hypothetical protein
MGLLFAKKVERLKSRGTVSITDSLANLLMSNALVNKKPDYEYAMNVSKLLIFVPWCEMGPSCVSTRNVFGSGSAETQATNTRTIMACKKTNKYSTMHKYKTFIVVLQLMAWEPVLRIRIRWDPSLLFCRNPDPVPDVWDLIWIRTSRTGSGSRFWP